MRLINTTTHELNEFFDINVPPYAILSHTWVDGEVSFREFQQPHVVQPKKGCAKIEHCCRQAVKDLLGWVWVDTCCIDKSSSAELTEAINSMFEWYKNAKVCYVYLSDVQSGPIKDDAILSDFLGSRWFTRGWTLQELIAPKSLVFYDKNWNEFGSKASLSSFISRSTGIGESILNPTTSAPWDELNSVSIAKRMSWASNRETTRIEDMAYCLMGLFGVNMPLLYGEGMKAFTRLQEEIIKDSEDQSIFSWISLDASNRNKDGTLIRRGLLANSPVEFSYCGNVIPCHLPFLSSPYWMTNRGLRIELPLIPTNVVGFYNALISCQEEVEVRSILAIDLVFLENDRFFRVNTNQVRKFPMLDMSLFVMKTIYVRMDNMMSKLENLTGSFRLRGLEGLRVGQYHLSEVTPLELWAPRFMAIRRINSDLPHHQVAGLLFEAGEGKNFVIVLGFAKATGIPKPWITIHIKGTRETLAAVVNGSRLSIGDDIDEEGEIELKDGMSVKVALSKCLIKGYEVTDVDISLWLIKLKIHGGYRSRRHRKVYLRTTVLVMYGLCIPEYMDGYTKARGNGRFK